MSRFIGVDLHKKVFTVSFYDVKTKKHRLKGYQMKSIEAFRKELDEEDIIGVEITGNTRYFVKKIIDKVKEVKLINPTKFDLISKSMKKTDKQDAMKIAEFISSNEVPQVKLKEDLSSQIASLASTRDKFVQMRTVMKNKVHGLLNGYGIVLEREELSSKKGLRNVFKYKIDPIAAIELEIIVKEIEHLNDTISKLDKELEENGKKLDGFESITSIKGIGSKSGAILLSIIDNVNRFDSEKKLASYFGIVPRVHQSNEKEWQGHITKHGSRLGRTTLVQCTWIAIKYSKYLKTFYEKIKAKKGSGKAIIATAKKLLGIIYNTLKNKWVFEDFPNFVIKTG
jgi:transposase